MTARKRHGASLCSGPWCPDNGVMADFFDTHAHLDFPDFAADLDAVVERAQLAGITRVVCIGTTLAGSRRVVELAARFPSVYAVVGVHPNHAHEEPENIVPELTELVRQPKVVGIGETGLDRYWDRAPFDMQEDYFRRHLEFCRSRQLPVIIHCREAEADVVRMLREQFDQHGPIAGLMHSFAGDAPTATSCLEMGLHISFSGMITFPKSDALREAAQVVPMDRLLVETDAPYLAPQAVRGKRNEPAFVVETDRHRQPRDRSNDIIFEFLVKRPRSKHRQ